MGSSSVASSIGQFSAPYIAFSVSAFLFVCLFVCFFFLVGGRGGGGGGGVETSIFKFGHLYRDY